MAEPILYHRAPAFVELYARVLERLPRCSRRATTCCCSPRPARARWSPRSPTSSRPATRCSRASAASSASAGSSSADAYGADARPLRAGLGPAGRPGRDRPRCSPQNAGIEVVFTTLCETSTGIVNDVQAIAEVATRHGAMIAVDAVSGLGAVDVRQDEWGVDVVAAGSQKALMCPPGLALLPRSPSAPSSCAAARPGGRYYFDWQRPRRASARTRRTARSRRAVSLLQALDVALGHDRGRGARRRLRAPRAARPRDPRRRQGARASSSSATGRARERRHRRRAARGRSTAARSRRSCATATASPPTAARASSRARSCASPTPATSARSTSS